MKFLLYSQCGEGAQILKRIELEGNEVGLFVKDPLYRTVFDGILPKVKPDSFIDKGTVILFDMSGNGKVADSYRRKGHLVYGGSSIADDLEHDRQFGFDTMKECGIKIPEHKEFTDFNAGMKYVRESNKRLVFKPSGSMPCKLTYVSKDADELESYLKFVEKHFGKEIDSFILQDFVEGGVISSELFYSNGEIACSPNHTIEVKKSMNDDLGPSTGCSGNIVWLAEANRILDEGVKLTQEFCKKHQYTGQIDLNAVVNEEGIYGLEWTPRFGYDATPTLFALARKDFGEFFYSLANGQKQDDFFSSEFAGGVRVTIPPYPAEPEDGADTEDYAPNMGVPIQKYEENCESFYFYEVCMDEEALIHSGGTGVIACAVGTGDDAEESLKEPYKILKDLNVPDKQYRTDLGKVLPKMFEEIEQYA